MRVKRLARPDRSVAPDTPDGCRQAEDGHASEELLRILGGGEPANEALRPPHGADEHAIEEVAEVREALRELDPSARLAQVLQRDGVLDGRVSTREDAVLQRPMRNLPLKRAAAHDTHAAAHAAARAARPHLFLRRCP